MQINEILYDFINDLNKSVNVGENEYTEDFDSKEFTAVDSETGETIKTKITVLEGDFADWDDTTAKYSYSFGLDANISLGEIDGYDFNADETLFAIKSYTDEIRGFIENQKKELEERLNDLNCFMGRIGQSPRPLGRGLSREA